MRRLFRLLESPERLGVVLDASGSEDGAGPRGKASTSIDGENGFNRDGSQKTVEHVNPYDSQLHKEQRLFLFIHCKSDWVRFNIYAESFSSNRWVKL